MNLKPAYSSSYESIAALLSCHPQRTSSAGSCCSHTEGHEFLNPDPAHHVLSCWCHPRALCNALLGCLDYLSLWSCHLVGSPAQLSPSPGSFPQLMQAHGALFQINLIIMSIYCFLKKLFTCMRHRQYSVDFTSHPHATCSIFGYMCHFCSISTTKYEIIFNKALLSKTMNV